MAFYEPLNEPIFRLPADALEAPEAPRRADSEIAVTMESPESSRATSESSRATSESSRATSESSQPSLDPGLTPVEVEELPLNENDRAIAVEIERKLRDWEDRREREQAGAASDEERRRVIVEMVHEMRDRLTAPEASVVSQVENLYNGLFGIERYLRNPFVSDILINGYDELFVEEKGEMKRLPSPLRSVDDLSHLISRLARLTAEKRPPTIDEPTIDSRFNFTMPDGKVVSVRININLGSITSSQQPTICLRKPVVTGYDHLETWTITAPGENEVAMSPTAANFLRTCFAYGANILIVGATGSGKTSLLKALIEAIPKDERVLVVEEANELDLRGIVENYVGLVARGRLTIADQIRTAMRMRPDRIVVGECREGSEVTGFLRAINTGHSGSITTIHASSARDGLQALLTLAASDSTNKAAVEHVGFLIRSGLDIVVYLGAQYVPIGNGKRRRIRRVMEIATISDFGIIDGSPVFTLTYPFGRFVGRGQGVTDIGAPLRNEGFGRLSPTFIARMRTKGLDEDALRALFIEEQRLDHSTDFDER